MVVAGVGAFEPRIGSCTEDDASVVKSGNALPTDDGLQSRDDVVPHRACSIGNLDSVGRSPGAFGEDGSYPPGGLAVQGCEPPYHFHMRMNFTPFCRVPTLVERMKFVRAIPNAKMQRAYPCVVCNSSLCIGVAIRSSLRPSRLAI